MKRVRGTNAFGRAAGMSAARAALGAAGMVCLLGRGASVADGTACLLGRGASVADGTACLLGRGASGADGTGCLLGRGVDGWGTFRFGVADIGWGRPSW